jgi:tRNA (uracil-5-)-methyltransferase
LNNDDAETFTQERYQTHLDEKVARFSALLCDHYTAALETFASAPDGFRMRAEFRIWHDAEGAHYAMTHAGQKTPYVIRAFPIGTPLIGSLMPPLLSAINASPTLAKRLFGVEFLTTLSGEALVTLLYHRQLDSQWQLAADKLQSDLGILLIGRSRKQVCVLERNYVTERLEVGNRSLDYRQVESGFTQPNAKINQKMLAWADACCRDNRGDLLELYCGNGNFTVALAGNFRRVLATEISKVATACAKHNLLHNGVHNVELVRMSSEDITQAIDRVRAFRRLENIDLDSYAFSTLLVDPPRAGLDPATVALATRFERIIYISCNPTTLMANLETLALTHRIVKAAVFDQFPWTEHLEVGLLLERKHRVGGS